MHLSVFLGILDIIIILENYKMTKLWLLIISMVLLTCSLDDEVVPCPADDQNFSNCFICKQVHRSEGNIYCACTKQ